MPEHYFVSTTCVSGWVIAADPPANAGGTDKLSQPKLLHVRICPITQPALS